MIASEYLQPNWASPPGNTIAEVMSDKKLSLDDFIHETELEPSFVRGLLSGTSPISDAVAATLSKVLGGSEEFWLNREHQYREDLQRIEDTEEDRREWVDKFPVADMIKFGWIRQVRGWIQKEAALLRFFEVADIDDWYQRYGDFHLEAAFRTSQTFDSQPESIVSWLRQGEIISGQIQCGDWGRDQFRIILDKVRPLTRVKDPAIFVPELTNALASVGVNLIILRTPARCRASGATFFNTAGEPLIILSFRYLSDDHFWFSFYHEAGHIFLHKSNQIFIETSGKAQQGEEEEEANRFATEILIPSKYDKELCALRANRWRDVARFAKKVGVSAGIVVGQLQHRGIVGHHQLNKFKARFKWTS